MRYSEYTKQALSNISLLQLWDDKARLARRLKIAKNKQDRNQYGSDLAVINSELDRRGSTVSPEEIFRP